MELGAVSIKVSSAGRRISSFHFLLMIVFIIPWEEDRSWGNLEAAESASRRAGWGSINSSI